MKTYLEYKDEKSHKFWQIAVSDNTFTVTYGKLGTDGQSKIKEFDTAEKANKEAEKVIKQKLKKGYQEVANVIQNKNIKELVKVFLYSDFKALNKLSLLKENAEILNSLESSNSPEMIKSTKEGESYIALIEEDIVFENNFFVDAFFDDIINNFTPNKTIQAIWFAGNVTINGTMYNLEKGDYSDAIIFEKPVRAKNIITGGTGLYFLDKVKSQLLYTQIQSEGFLSFKDSTSFIIQVDNNQIWKKNNKRYDFGEMSDDLTANNLDVFFINKDDFFVIDEDFDDEEDDTNETVHYYNLEDDELLVKTIISGKDTFKIEQ